ncbi:hypothetical protein RFI_25781 [Reticulomyxa filosa]|uniref:Uncharacterized protein n=1 Tax=Reticulomyxa filosa TaxID=46433 RepID=X6MEW1_RETFI|nr:hypothetical protein RFI_25781 [Reticulomyxa filosa]|eukprot:ETO11595.1 hypothetical protein RFI_25781 [Reticulomyxa filosa]
MDLYQDEWKVLTKLIAEQASRTVSQAVVQKKFCDMALKILHSEYLSQKERVLEKIEDKKEFEHYSKDDLDEIKIIRKNKLLGLFFLKKKI